MAITTDPHGHGREIEAVAGHHETRQQRHFKERMALWLFIGGDAVFLLLELFTWFYLRSLNTNGLWRGAQCTKANPCTDGLGNPITHEIATANPAYTLVIAGLAIVAALFVYSSEKSSARQSGRKAIAAGAGFAVLVLLGAIALQCYQYTTLPFSTIDGTYASTFEFFMMWNRARLGRYDDGHWYQARIIRVFSAWCAAATSILAIVMVSFG
jgi:heme/copper-type cytochrome/quinol oxidase subunit 3